MTQEPVIGATPPRDRGRGWLLPVSIVFAALILAGGAVGGAYVWQPDSGDELAALGRDIAAVERELGKDRASFASKSLLGSINTRVVALEQGSANERTEFIIAMLAGRSFVAGGQITTESAISFVELCLGYLRGTTESACGLELNFD